MTTTSLGTTGSPLHRESRVRESRTLEHRTDTSSPVQRTPDTVGTPHRIPSIDGTGCINTVIQQLFSNRYTSINKGHFREGNTDNGQRMNLGLRKPDGTQDNRGRGRRQ